MKNTLNIPDDLIKTAMSLSKYKTRIKAREKLTRDSDLLIDQIRAIDNRRITSGPIANLESELMKKVYQAVLEVIGINPFTAYSTQ